MRVLTLIENTATSEKLAIEHGLSLYIEHAGYKLLLDTGASDKFLKNADRMLVQISDLDFAVLSHSHSDHTGGLKTLLAECPSVRIFARQEITSDCYKQVGFLKIQISDNEGIYQQFADNFILFDKFQQVCEGVFLLSDEIENEHFFCKDRHLYVKKGGKYKHDTFTHELFMVIFPTLRVEDGCIILSSCSHRGIVNIIKTVRHNWPDVEILSVIGGFHLMGNTTKQLNCSAEYIEELADEITNLRVGMIYTCHCTGQKGYELLREHLGDQIQYLQTGEELEF